MTVTPAGPGSGPDAGADARRHRAEARHADQDRTLAAIQQLEAALGTAAPYRQQAWLAEVRRTLAILAEAASEEAGNAAQPDSLLSDISRTQPWLRNRVRGLRVHYCQLRDGIAALGQELDGQAGEAVDFTDVRCRCPGCWPGCATSGPANPTSSTRHTTTPSAPTWQATPPGRPPHDSLPGSGTGRRRPPAAARQQGRYCAAGRTC